MNALHQHLLTGENSYVWMVIPKRVFVTPPVLFMLKFLKRAFMAALFEIVAHSSADDAVGELQYSFGFVLAISEEMEMVMHDDVSKN